MPHVQIHQWPCSSFNGFAMGMDTPKMGTIALKCPSKWQFQCGKYMKIHENMLRNPLERGTTRFFLDRVFCT